MIVVTEQTDIQHKAGDRADTEFSTVDEVHLQLGVAIAIQQTPAFLRAYKLRARRWKIVRQVHKQQEPRQQNPGYKGEGPL